MLSNKFKATVAAFVVAASVAAVAAPAEAQYRRHRGDRGAAIGAGIALGVIGLGAAAIAADQRRQAYDDYYGPGYGYYGRPGYYYEAPPRVYYEAPRRAYRRGPAVDDRYPHTFREYQ
ncbi:hypothetical protein ACJ4V0_09310 [Phreatobacter sp. HK31-P]